MFPCWRKRKWGGSWSEIVARLRAVPTYVSEFNDIYEDGIQRENIKNAIAEFERSLITPNSRFDQYLRGDADAITDDEKLGYQKFKSYGCITCHQGTSVGGNLFEPFGVMGDYFSDRGNITEVDFGRFNVTGNEDDKFTFKVSSLRNVALTAPYFHDGTAETLEEAVTVMAEYQLGRVLSPEDVNQIVLFLKSLTGEYKGKLLE